jgi:hypothetical protein
MLEKIKEDIDKDLPKIGRLMDEAGDDIVKNLDQFMQNVASGLEKLFGEVEKPPED